MKRGILADIHKEVHFLGSAVARWPGLWVKKEPTG
jgi:hypothetical protein